MFDDLVGHTVDDIDIVAEAADQGIRAAAADQGIVAALADQRVISGVAPEYGVAVTTCQGCTRGNCDAADLDMSRVPESLWHSAEDIVESSLNGLPSNELFVIPGWRYQTWVALQKVLPREVIYAITKKSTTEFRKSKHG